MIFVNIMRPRTLITILCSTALTVALFTRANAKAEPVPDETKKAPVEIYCEDPSGRIASVVNTCIEVTYRHRCIENNSCPKGTTLPH